MHHKLPCHASLTLKVTLAGHMLTTHCQAPNLIVSLASAAFMVCALANCNEATKAQARRQTVLHNLDEWP